MKPLFSFVALLLVISSFCACKKTTNSGAKGDYLIIYHAGGITGGNLKPFYLLTSDSLSADTVHNFIASPVRLSNLNATWHQSNTKFNNALPLLNSIPKEMMAFSNSFGVTSGNDMSGIVVKGQMSGRDYEWSFAGDLSGCSTEVKQYAASLADLFK